MRFDITLPPLGWEFSERSVLPHGQEDCQHHWVDGDSRCTVLSKSYLSSLAFLYIRTDQCHEFTFTIFL